MDGRRRIGKYDRMKLFLLPLIFVLLSAFSAVDEVQSLIDAGKVEEAFALAKKRSDAGNAEGDEELAWFYDQGKAVAENKVEAARFYHRAAEAGRRHAQWRFGVMLDQGEGMEADPVAAVRWFRKAAAQHYPFAYVSLGVMYATGRGVEQDFSESRRMYLAGAKLGEPHGFYGVGVLHLLGQGVAEDRVESLAWMLIAASLGDEEAHQKVPLYGLPSADTLRAARRAKEIALEFGLTGLEFEFRDLDAAASPNA